MTDAAQPQAEASRPVLRVAIYDDVVAARGEHFHIPGLAVDVYSHADDAARSAVALGYDIIFMDFAMGSGRKSGAVATAELRSSGFAGRIIAISSDPAANAAMKRAGADEDLSKKAHMRSYLVHLGAQHLRRGR